jgi:16S rRNA (guanine527-N7)-methyltransferase
MHLEFPSVDTARIAALLHPFLESERTLPEVSLQQISTYIDLLLRWNARINLTAVRDPDNIVTRHFGESLFLARHLFPEPLAPDALVRGAGQSPAGASRVLDIGSGAGFPGLPLKIWAPAIHLTLIESNHKKATFLREVARELRLTDINVMTDRAEALASRSDFPPADLVTLRAVEHFETILPLAARFVAAPGRLTLLIGVRQLPMLSSLVPGLHWQPPINIPNSDARVLAVGSH